MTTLTDSALIIALVHSASTAPTLLVGLIAGTMADIVERRSMIKCTQVALTVSAIVLAITVWLGAIGPASLLLLTFVVGTGFAFYLPTQQSAITDLVAPKELPNAVALASVAMNLARVVGPALAGAIAVILNPSWGLAICAALFVPMFFALPASTGDEAVSISVRERILSGAFTGLRYARYSNVLRALIARALGFGFCASVFWALLPLIARDHLGYGAGGFGLLSACFGVGAIVGATAMPYHLRQLSMNRIVTYGALLFALACVIIALTKEPTLAFFGTAAAGMAWVSVFSTLSAGMQSNAPRWVRARAVAIFLVVVQGSMALGSLLWGTVADSFGTAIALASAAGTLAFSQLVYRSTRVEMGDESKIEYRHQLLDINIVSEPSADDGPVLVQVRYQVEEKNRVEFLEAIRELGQARRRNGAKSWTLFRDLGHEIVFVESFLIRSWSEFIRLRSRITVVDRTLQQHVSDMQRENVPIQVSRLIAVKVPMSDERLDPL